MIISDLVGGEVVSVAPSDSLLDAILLMHDREVGSVAVLVADALVGIFTERDVLNAVAKGIDFEVEPVSSHMTLLPDSFGPDQPVGDAADWMLATGYRHLPLVDEVGRVVGMVSIKDVLWGMTDPEAV